MGGAVDVRTLVQQADEDSSYLPNRAAAGCRVLVALSRWRLERFEPRFRDLDIGSIAELDQVDDRSQRLVVRSRQDIRVDPGDRADRRILTRTHSRGRAVLHPYAVAPGEGGRRFWLSHRG